MRAARVVHAGGSATGAEIERALDTATRAAEIAVFEQHFAFELVGEDDRIVGVLALDPSGHVVEVRAAHVLLATGGVGQLFAVTTNPVEATGDGTAMALRAGVAVADLEFLQFHPTALHVAAMPRPLLTEALRGHGAVLRGPDGERFIDELEPRDVVSRAETAVMIDTHTDHVWLDATGLADFSGRFPNIAAELARLGLDPTTDWLPVAPAAHYASGGVVTDLSGASSAPGLWAAGEAACTGVHGANRLASNSLLEGLVFGPRVIEAIVSGQDGPRPHGAMRALFEPDHSVDGDGGSIGARWLTAIEVDSREPTVDNGCSRTEVDHLRAELQRVMTFEAGVLRNAQSLDHVAAVLASTAERIGAPRDPRTWELVNLCTVGRALAQAAAARAESRGVHTRSDHPDTDPAFRLRFVHR